MTQELNQKNYQGAFEQLFGSDNETAGVTYRQLRMQLVRFFKIELVHFFRRRKMSDVSVVEDLADEVMMRVLQKLAEGSVIENVKAYTFGVARNVAHEHKKRPQLLSLDADFDEEKADEKRLMIPIWDPAPQIEELERAEQVSLLEECINELRPEDRELLGSYYLFEKQDREKLKAESGMRAGNLRVRIFRIRKHLEMELRRKMDELKQMGS